MANKKILVTQDQHRTIKKSVEVIRRVASYKARLDEQEQAARAKLAEVAPCVWELNGVETGEIARGVIVSQKTDVSIDNVEAYKAVMQNPHLQGQMLRVPAKSTPLVVGLVIKLNNLIEQLQNETITPEQAAGILVSTGKVSLESAFDLNAGAYKGGALANGLPIVDAKPSLVVSVNLTSATEGDDWAQIID